MYKTEDMLSAIEAVVKEEGLSPKTATRLQNLYRKYNFYYDGEPLTIERLNDKNFEMPWGCGKTARKVLIKALLKLKEEKKEVMKVFISLPMNGRTEEEIDHDLHIAWGWIQSLYPDKHVEVIDNIHKDAPKDAGRLWYLGDSIQLMEEADAIYFAPGWMKSHGCRVEFAVATEYGLTIIE